MQTLKSNKSRHVNTSFNISSIFLIQKKKKRKAKLFRKFQDNRKNEGRSLSKGILFAADSHHRRKIFFLQFKQTVCFISLRPWPKASSTFASSSKFYTRSIKFNAITSSFLRKWRITWRITLKGCFEVAARLSFSSMNLCSFGTWKLFACWRFYLNSNLFCQSKFFTFKKSNFLLIIQDETISYVGISHKNCFFSSFISKRHTIGIEATLNAKPDKFFNLRREG